MYKWRHFGTLYPAYLRLHRASRKLVPIFGVSYAEYKCVLKRRDEKLVTVVMHRNTTRRGTDMAASTQRKIKYECTMDQELYRKQQANDLTCTRRGSGQPAEAAGHTCTAALRAAANSGWNSRRPSWKYKYVSEFWLPSVDVYPAKFHQIWNDGALGFFEEQRPCKNNSKMCSDMRSVTDPIIDAYGHSKLFAVKMSQ